MVESERATRDDTAFERRDAPPALVAKIAAGLAAVIIAVPLHLLVGFPHAVGDRPEPPNLAPPAPRLQYNEFADLAALRRVEQDRLETYGWVDRDHGVVHIPIEQAMRLTAQRGVPDWPQAGRRQ
jgi:hypothetical protein